MVTVRADLYGEFGAFPDFARRLETSQVLLGALRDEDLIRAVEEPARRCGLFVEAGLAELIVAELSDAPGTLRSSAMRCARPGRGARDAGSPLRATANRAACVRRSRPRPSARCRRSTTKATRWRAASSCAWSNCGPMAKTRVAGLPATSSSRSTRSGPPMSSRHSTDARLLVVDRDQITLVHEALLRACGRDSAPGSRSNVPNFSCTRNCAGRPNDGTKTDGATPTSIVGCGSMPRSISQAESASPTERRSSSMRALRSATANRPSAAAHAASTNPRRRHVDLGRDRAPGRRGRDRSAQRRPGLARRGRGVRDAAEAAARAAIEGLVGQSESIARRSATSRRSSQSRHSGSRTRHAPGRPCSRPSPTAKAFSTRIPSTGRRKLRHRAARWRLGVSLERQRPASAVRPRHGRGRRADGFDGNGSPDPGPIVASADGALLAQAVFPTRRRFLTTVAVYETATNSERFPSIVVEGWVESLAFSGDGTKSRCQSTKRT